MPSQIKIAVNGWAVGSFDAPARLSLQSLLGQLAVDPGLHLEVFAAEVSLAGIKLHPVPPARGPFGRAIFDQFDFPRAAGRLGTDLLLYLHPGGPIAGSLPFASWSGEDTSAAWEQSASRLERALSQTGMRGAAAVLCPSDLPRPASDLRWVHVPPPVPQEVFAVPSDSPSDVAELPEAFVLTVGETPETLRLLLAAWSWVEGSLGDSTLLLVCGRTRREHERQAKLLERAGAAGQVRTLLPSDQTWPRLFQRASALLHAGEAHNAAALRWALAAGLPVAAPATPVAESILGPAGYLTPAVARALGAACLTLLVEENLAVEVRGKAAERGARYAPTAAAAAWAEALRRVAR
jgi:glycosyltransferase involved in cell wall biosynthesis